jgi:hypothetical protein
LVCFRNIAGDTGSLARTLRENEREHGFDPVQSNLTGFSKKKKNLHSLPLCNVIMFYSVKRYDTCFITFFFFQNDMILN